MGPGSEINGNMDQQGSRPMRTLHHLLKKLLLVSGVVIIVACGSDHSTNPSERFPLFVNVNGLSRGQILLTNNNGITEDGDKLYINANGIYQFSTRIPAGSKYLVQVASQPTGQLCTVTNASGVASATMTTVNVTCSAIDQTHAVSGNISGLQGGYTVLLNNGTDKLMINVNGPFRFLQRIANNSGYEVTIAVQPSGQQCAVTNAEGSHVTHDVNNIIVTCGMVQYAFSLGGTVTGLTSGTVTLNNLNIDGVVVDVLSVPAKGLPSQQFVFNKKVVFNGYYKVTVAHSPAGQVCSVSNASGNNVTKDITDVAVSCVADNDSFTISGKLSGLDPGTQITLDNNGDKLPLSSDGPFMFKKAVANGSEYDVTIVGDFPFLQDCAIRNGTGKVDNAPVSNVYVFCYPAPVTVVYSFPVGPVNYYPVGLIQAQDGTFYGTATSVKVGPHAFNHKTGYIFTMINGLVTTPDDACKTPDSWCFAGAGNYWKQAPALPTGIMQAKDSNIYGTTFLAATSDANFDFGGAIYKLDTSSKTLVQNDDLFPSNANGGSGPVADLVQDDDGNFYGTTYGNTWVDGAVHGGSIFKRAFDGSKMNCPDGTTAKVCTLHIFNANDRKNGFHPNSKLTLVKDKLSGESFLYGVTENGGAYGKGLIFKFDLSRLKLDVIASFNDTANFSHQRLKLGQLFFYDPYDLPYSGLIQAKDGDLYGVTKYGGRNDAGTIFKISPTSPYTFTVLYEFEKGNGYPAFELVQLKDGNLYGITQGMASSLINTASIFRIKPDGTFFTILHSFFNDTNSLGAARPSTRLVAGSNDTSLYGGTQFGGYFNQGTIYKLGRR